jgi:phosphoenolpyruvate phosphomutase
MTPAQRLRKRLSEPGPVLAIGGHSPLSAVLAQEAGFDAVWASGFEISAAHAVPDANILTMAEQLNVAKLMARRIDIPVIADCDNGFGNAINVIRTVRDYEADGIAGICMEDNIFPKRCSFYAGVKRELVSAEEHAGKVRAALDARRTKDFVVIARTEAYIAGWGLEEAERRAHAYADAGADMILVHSKAKEFDELKAFAQGWTRPTPLVAVPTIYNHVSADELHEAGFKLVIFANHGLRSTIKSMRGTFATLMKEQKAEAVEDRIVPLTDVYELIGVPQMKADEASYLPGGGDTVRAVILAAGEPGEELREVTGGKPKALLEVRGKSILEHQVAALNQNGVKDISVVRGYAKEAIKLPGVRYYDAERWQEEGELSSLLAAKNELRDRVVILYGDVLFDPAILSKLLQSTAETALVVDRAWNDRGEEGPSEPDLVRTAGSSEESFRYVGGSEEEAILEVGRGIKPDAANGEFAGMLMLSPAGAEQFLAALQAAGERGGAFHEAKDLSQAALTDMIQELITQGRSVSAVSIYKGWSEVDTFADYRRAWAQKAK